MRKSSLVLLSGGLDSFACLHWASLHTDLVCGLSIDYGQKAAAKEIEAAAKICAAYDIKHKVLELPFFSQFTSSSLIGSQAIVPELSVDELDNQVMTKQSAKSVWVPNRNGILINIAAGIAENEQIDSVLVGFNAEEAATFPDNSAEFAKSVSEALSYSTRNQVKVLAPMAEKVKADIVAWLMDELVDLSLLWSCYLGDEKMCGSCESCQRLKRALVKSGGESWIAKLF